MRAAFRMDENGNIFRTSKTSSRVSLTDPAGSVGAKGYLRTSLNNRDYYVHRIVWYLLHGSWPVDDIDHANGVKTDNSPANLRLASRSQNLRNKPATGRNTSGYLGVCYLKRMGKYTAYITDDAGRTIKLGYFDDPELAALVRDEAASRHYNEFAYLNTKENNP